MDCCQGLGTHHYGVDKDTVSVLIAGMTLDEFLKKQKLNNAAFGRLIGVSGETIRRYRINERWPDREQMIAITEATGGEVKPNDFIANESPP